MLECGANFKGSLRYKCSVCNVVDDENHRLNTCKKYRNLNIYDHATKVNFVDVYSSNLTVVKQIIVFIERIWNTRSAHGTMRTVPNDTP